MCRGKRWGFDVEPSWVNGRRSLITSFGHCVLSVEAEISSPSLFFLFLCDKVPFFLYFFHLVVFSVLGKFRPFVQFCRIWPI